MSSSQENKASSTWLEGFQQAAPSQRHTLLLEQLQAEQTVLDAEALGYAVASVNQMLAHHNLYAEMKVITNLLKQRYPEQYQTILPAVLMLEFDEALADRAPERLPALLDQFFNYPDPIPEALWLTLIDRMSYHQYGDQAAKLARQLLDRLEEADRNDEDPFQNRLRETLLLDGIQTCWRNPDAPAVQSAYDDLIVYLGYDQDPEIREIVYQQRDADIDTQLNVVLEKFSKRATYSAIHNGQMAFGRWMLDQHGLNLYTSAEIMSHAVMLWRQNPAREDAALDLKTLVKLDSDQLDAYFEAYTQESGSPDELLTLCWGLPLVYDWLHTLGHVPAEARSELKHWLEPHQQQVIEELAQALWSYDFVHLWPRPSQVTGAEFEAESRQFAATRNQSEPLSDDPADSALFDEDEDLLNEDMLGFMMQQLSQLGPEEQKQLLGMMANEFGEDAADEMAALISDPSQVMTEFGELIKKQPPGH